MAKANRATPSSSAIEATYPAEISSSNQRQTPNAHKGVPNRLSSSFSSSAKQHKTPDATKHIGSNLKNNADLEIDDAQIKRDNAESVKEEKMELSRLQMRLEDDLDLDPEARTIAEEMVRILKRIGKNSIARRMDMRAELARVRRKFNAVDSRPTPVPAKSTSVEPPAKKVSRLSLKDLIASQHEELAQSQEPASTAKRPSPSPHRSVYDASDDSDSESSQSDDGDFMYDGTKGTLQKPHQRRS
jgi:hypothetical protein